MNKEPRKKNPKKHRNRFEECLQVRSNTLFCFFLCRKNIANGCGQNIVSLMLHMRSHMRGTYIYVRIFYSVPFIFMFIHIIRLNISYHRLCSGHISHMTNEASQTCVQSRVERSRNVIGQIEQDSFNFNIVFRRYVCICVTTFMLCRSRSRSKGILGLFTKKVFFFIF